MSLTGSRFSSDSAPRALPSWGFEDEVEQSFGRPCRQCDGRFKRTYELTSSIVPRETSFHRGVELDFLLLHWILHRSQAAATSPNPPMKWRNSPNLSLRPARPSFNRGPVQRRAKRALLVLGTASTSTITQWTHRRPTPGITRSTRRALAQIGAVRVGRAATIGRPWLWRLRDVRPGDWMTY